MSFDDRNANQIFEQDICAIACRALWCDVIKQQITIALKPTKIDQPYEIDAARRWFGSRDFFMACALAGVDGRAVLSGVRQKLQMAGVA